MKINILTLFPEMFEIFNYSILGRAKEKGILDFDIVNIRDFTLSKHKKVDDYPYGGGAGMVIGPQPIIDAIKSVKNTSNSKVIFLGPRGKTFNHELAKELSQENELTFICGHYEGIDERCFKYIDMEISLGDFILTGGEIAAIPIIDSTCRLVDGVLGKAESHMDESFSDGLLEYPQYTRPEEFQGDRVPDVLLSGHHENIRKWRRKMSLEITRDRRPDLFEKIELSKEDMKLLKDIK